MSKWYLYWPTVWIWLIISFTSFQKGAEREAFSIQGDCCKSFNGDSQAYSERRLPECILRVAVTLEKMHYITQWLLRTWPKCWCLILNNKGFQAYRFSLNSPLNKCCRWNKLKFVVHGWRRYKGVPRYIRGTSKVLHYSAIIHMW